MSRDIRNNIHKKQDRLQLQKGVPNVRELKEGVPVLRSVSGVGIVQYIKYNGELYQSVFSKYLPVRRAAANNISLLHDNSSDFSEIFPGTVSNIIDDNTASIQDDLATLAAKTNEIIRALRESNIINQDQRELDEKGK